MDLINIYVQEVARRLPEKIREDISLELRSTILDMLPDDFTDNDVNQALESLGNPAVLASRYRDRPMHLIGPKFYDIYMTLLKMISLIVVIVTFILFFIGKSGYIFGSGLSPLVIASTVLGEAIWILLESIIQVFFWVSIVFIILERTIGSSDDIALSLLGKKWTPKELTHIHYIPLKREIKMGEVLFALFWTIVWALLYFNASNIIGIYEKGNDGLELVLPIFNQETLMSYLVIVLIVMGLELFRVVYMAIVRQWTFKLALSNTFIHLVSLFVLIVIVNNPHLFHPEFVPYMADLVDKPFDSVIITVNWIKWAIIATMIVTSVIDAYNGFRKTKIN